MAPSRTPVAGSERPPLAGARRVGDTDPNRRIEVTVTLRRRSAAEPAESMDAAALDRAAFAERYGADPGDIERLEEFATEHHLDAVQASAARRSVVLAGTIADMSAAFGTELALYEHPLLGTLRGRAGALTVPDEIGPAVESVLGLDDRPAAIPHFRRLDTERAAPRAYKPQEIAALYGFPTDSNRKGQTVAVIELGGGFKTADLNAYWAEMGVAPKPRVVAVGVDGAGNHPDGPDGADGEVMLDIVVVGAVAPGARIAVYFAPKPPAASCRDHDGDPRHAPQAVGRVNLVGDGRGRAQGWTEQARRAYDQAFQDAAALGVSVCCASGDDGSAHGLSDGEAHVDFPAASPWVLACGGTRLESSGTTIVAEVTWHEPGHGATGGGVSRFFQLPAYQAHAHVPEQVDVHKPGRGIPDVAGDADPLTGYRVRVDGQDMVIGGTSAVAPLYAALIAQTNSKLGRSAGFLNPELYAHASLRDIVDGDNGAYRAGAG